MAIDYPFGAADTSLALSATGAQALTISNQVTVVDGVAIEATGHRTINLTIGSGVREGAMLLIQSKTNASENNVFGSNITGPTVAGSAGKTKNFKFMYNGTAFVQVCLSVQID